MVSDREAEPVAKEYFAAGFHVLILNYAVKPKAINFVPLCQLTATVAHVRNHALAWNVDVEKIAVCGFSAGGHLAAYGQYNIQCNGLGPGYIETPQTAPLRELQDDGSKHPFDQFICAKTPANRWLKPEELTGPAIFLASDAYAENYSK